MPKAIQLGEEARKQSPGQIRFIGQVATIATKRTPAEGAQISRIGSLPREQEAVRYRFTGPSEEVSERARPKQILIRIISKDLIVMGFYG